MRNIFYVDEAADHEYIVMCASSTGQWPVSRHTTRKQAQSKAAKLRRNEAIRELLTERRRLPYEWRRQ